MEIRNRRRMALRLVVLGAAAALGFAGAPVVQSFIPPRTAVVNIAEVFENYEKRKDRQAELQAKIDVVLKELKQLETEYKSLVDDLKLIQQGSDTFNQKTLKLTELKLKIDDLRNKEAKKLEDTLREFLTDLRDEISKEIVKVATDQDLDLVLEKTVTAENRGAGVGFQWPIVHFVKPEYEITQEVTKRLNDVYARK
jgi:Skp family chaperone for outer membrane proteins